LAAAIDKKKLNPNGGRYCITGTAPSFMGGKIVENQCKIIRGKLFQIPPLKNMSE